MSDFLGDLAERGREAKPRPTGRPNSRKSNNGIKKRIALPDPWQPFPTDVLPQPVRGYVRECAAAIGCDESFVVLPLLSALAATIGNSRRIQLKRGWTEPAVLWTVIVGESGTMKTPALDLPLKPLRRSERLAIRKYESEIERYRDDLLRHKTAAADWQRNGRKTGDAPPAEPSVPICERRVVSDVTVEALAVKLKENPRGLLLHRDELAGWLRSFDQYKAGRGGDAQHWLTMHGAGNMTVDRKGTGTMYVPLAAVSICGGIQPTVLRASLVGEHFENGLAARLLFACPPRRARRWTHCEVPQRTERELTALYERLTNLDSGIDADGEPEPILIALDDAAMVVWVNYVDRHGREQLEHVGPLAAVWSKLEAAAARLALIVHLVRSSLDPSLTRVDAESIQAGIAMSDWFGYEAVRAFGLMTESDENREQRKLIEWISAQGGVVTVRDVTHGPRRHRGDTEAAEQSLNALSDAGLGSWIVVSTGKRQRREFRLAPVVPAPLSPDTAEIRQNGAGAGGVTSGNTNSDDAADAGNRAAELAAAHDQEADSWSL